MLMAPLEEPGEAPNRPESEVSFPHASIHRSASPAPDLRMQRLDTLELRDDLSDREDEDREDEEQDPSKRRAPRRRQSTATCSDRARLRRHEANARERSRMHGLNSALESLRKVVPCYSSAQKLSKIETLRLAKNYIRALSETLSAGTRPDLVAFARTLCKGLSQPTTNLVAGCLQLNSGRFLAESGDVSPPCEGPYAYSSPEPGAFSGRADSSKHFRTYYSNVYDSYYSGTSPDANAARFDSQISPPNYNGVFTFQKPDEQAECGASCRYGGRCCGSAGRPSVSRPYVVSPDSHFPYELRMRNHPFQNHEELNSGFHN